MEAGALHHSAAITPGFAGRSPLLKLKSDEQLIALTRRGQQGAFETLVQRYQSRLLAFCRHMLNSTEDAEDILQEVFAAAYNAMIADERPINARPWLYRIARNRCLNHLRRPVNAGQDSMDVFERDGGATTADTVHKREEFRQIVSDVQDLPETQRTALLLREIDALSYDDIASTMDTTVPSVKSLLVRARVSLAEAAEARLLTCAEVRLELGQVAEGIARTTAPVRRHLKGCERCRVFRTELRRANRALAAVYPLSFSVVAKKFLAAKIGLGAGAGAGTTAGGGSGAAAAGSAAAAGGATLASSGAGGVLAGGLGTIVSKAAAGLAAAAIVTAGAVEAKHVERAPTRHTSRAPLALAAPPPPLALHAAQSVAPAPPIALSGLEQPKAKLDKKKAKAAADAKAADKKHQTAAATQPATQTPQPTTTTAAPTTNQPAGQTTTGSTQQDGSTVALGPNDGTQPQGSSGDQASGGDQESTSPPGESTSAPPQPQPAPIVGEPHAGTGSALTAHRTPLATRGGRRHRGHRAH